MSLPLKFALKGEEVITIELGCKYEEPGAYCLKEETDLSIHIHASNNIDTATPGEYMVKYFIEYNSDRYLLKRKVIVVDSKPPEILLYGDKNITVYTTATYKEPGFIAYDNYDGDITNRVKVMSEKLNDFETKLIYTVKDSAGNEQQEVRFLKYVTPENKDLIYLTFDDGPHKNITPQVLDILKEYNVNATFFVLNFEDSLIPVVHRVIEEGNAIAIHGYSHYYKEIYASEEAYLNNIKLMQDRIKEVTGIHTNITRFPYGSYNTISEFNPGIMAILRKRVPEEGFAYYDWNVSTGDGVSTTSPEDIINYFIKGLKRGRINIILMHDSWGHENTVAALPQIIEYGLENGYCFGVINEYTPPLY